MRGVFKKRVRKDHEVVAVSSRVCDLVERKKQSTLVFAIGKADEDEDRREAFAFNKRMADEQFERVVKENEN